jgi:Fe-Mn family superoxide dismutase
MELHHGKHHAAYIKNLNEAVTGTPFEGLSIEDILKKVTAKDAKIRNNGGGHYNHSLFWQSLAPATGQMPTGKLLAAINAKFGSMEQFKEAFNTAAKGVFGSGWVWLLTNNKGDMWIQTTPNQDNPLMKRLVKRTGKPLLMLDVWEHAYYLKYQNKRADYIDAFWKVINWQEIAKRM